MKNALLILTIIFSLNAGADCANTLKKCDLAVRALQADNKAKQEIIDLQTLTIQEQNAVISENSRWYHNPAVVIPVTIVLTILGVRLAR